MGGLTMGADPIVVAASVAASHAGLALHGFLVRKMEKSTGWDSALKAFAKRGLAW